MIDVTVVITSSSIILLLVSSLAVSLEGTRSRLLDRERTAGQLQGQAEAAASEAARK